MDRIVWFEKPIKNFNTLENTIIKNENEIIWYTRFAIIIKNKYVYLT